MTPEQLLQAEETVFNATRDLGAAVVVSIILAVIALAIVGLLVVTGKPLIGALVESIRGQRETNERSNQTQERVARVLEQIDARDQQQTTILQNIVDRLAKTESASVAIADLVGGARTDISTLDDDLDAAMSSLREHVIATADKTVLALTGRFDTVLVAVKALEQLVRDYNAQTFSQNAEALNAISKLEQGVSTMRAALLEEIKLAVPVIGTGSTPTTEKIVAEGT